ncbi:hypothetical protein MAHJHV47_46170 [Mycobacterium avium subsp. hominissuis]
MLVAGAAGDEHTQRANCEAFKRWGLYPRMGIAPEQLDGHVALFGGDPHPRVQAPAFFQLYTPPDRKMAASLVHRAEAAILRSGGV